MNSKTILFLAVFSLLLFFQTSFSQVEIKEEILLSEIQGDEIESVTFTMPFYWGVHGGINSGGLYWGYLKGIEINAGGQTQLVSCTPPCASCIYSGPEWSIGQLPAGTPVTIKVYGTCSGSQLIESGSWIEQTSTYQYNIKYYAGSYWQNQTGTTVIFSAQPPPDCSYAPECDENYIEEMPPLAFENRDPSFFTNMPGCDRDPGVMGFFAAGKRASESSDIYFYDENDIGLCFDPQRQKLKFDFSNQYVTMNYVKYICEDNITDPYINATIINSKDEIDQLTLDRCLDLFNSITAHYYYPLWNISGIHDGFAFKEILETHETEHLNDWLHYIEKYQNSYYSIPEMISVKCSDYVTYLAAQQGILQKIKEKFWINFYNAYKTDYLVNEHLLIQDDPEHLKLEQKLHNREIIQSMVDEYKYRILVRCGSIIGNGDNK